MPPPVNVAPMTAQAVPSLPAVFRGCWQGRCRSSIGFGATRPARTKSVSGRPRLIGSVTGASAINRSRSPSPKPASRRAKRLSIRYGNVVPITTDGREYAAMRSRLNFDEYKTRPDGLSPTFSVDETTNLDCHIAGDDMMVNADVFGTRDGEPWFTAHWRADFRRARPISNPFAACLSGPPNLMISHAHSSA